MQFNTGANVHTADGDHIGDISHVVMDPNTKEITHLIVEKGFLFTEDKVVPVELVGKSTGDGVILRPNAGKLEDSPAYDETSYVPSEQANTPPPEPTYAARAMYWYPSVGYSNTYGVSTTYPFAPYVQSEQRNIPEGTVALEEGASVIDRNGEHVGDLERLYTDAESGRATHLLISSGFLLKEERLVPTNWINHVMEDEVHLSVDARFVNDLPEYKPQE